MNDKNGGKFTTLHCSHQYITCIYLVLLIHLFILLTSAVLLFTLALLSEPVSGCCYSICFKTAISVIPCLKIHTHGLYMYTYIPCTILVHSHRLNTKT